MISYTMIQIGDAEEEAEVAVASSEYEAGNFVTLDESMPTLDTAHWNCLIDHYL
jgi:hypothetical protein